MMNLIRFINFQLVNSSKVSVQMYDVLLFNLLKPTEFVKVFFTEIFYVHVHKDNQTNVSTTCITFLYIKPPSPYLIVTATVQHNNYIMMVRRLTVLADRMVVQ